MAEQVADGAAAPLLSVSELARRLGLSVQATKKIAPAELPYTRVGSRGDRRYQAEDVDAYLARRRVES